MLVTLGNSFLVSLLRQHTYLQLNNGGMHVVCMKSNLKVTFMLLNLKVLILYPNMQQEENNSLTVSNDRHRVENATIRRVVDWLEEQVNVKEGKTSEK